MGLRDVDEKSIRGMTHTDDKGVPSWNFELYPSSKIFIQFLVIRSELIASKDGLTTYEISNFYKDYFKEVNGSLRTIT